MTAIDTDFTPDRQKPLGLILRALRHVRAFLTIAEDPIDTAERRAFVIEMLDRNSDAFASDFDVQTMLQHFPGRF